MRSWPSMLKIICSNERICYLQDNKFIDVDRLNNILDNWQFFGYDVKRYTMKCKNKSITVFYRKGIDRV